MSGILEDMEAFASVAAAGSFSAAARRLDTSKSRLSRRVAGLESRLGVTLLHRTTRRLSLTQAGATYLEQVTRILEQARCAEEELAGLAGMLVGTVKLTAPMSFGLAHVAPVLRAFMAENPRVSVDAALDDGVRDLVGEGFDLAVRIGPPLADSSLIARVVSPVRAVVVGSPDYLARAGRPAGPEALVEHPCLVYANRGGDEQWRFDTPAGPKSYRGPERLRANNGDMLAEAAAEGLGLAVLPTFIVGPAVRAGRLVALFEAGDHEAAVRLVHPPARPMTAKTRALADRLAAELAAAPWERGWPAS